MTAAASAQQAGSIRGMVYDKEFEAPLAAAQVTIVETGAKVTASDEGNYVFDQVPPGTYTLVFSKDGYVRQVKANVVVSPGQMTEVDIWLSGEFVEMEEFIVQDLEVGGGSEAALLALRMEAPGLMDSISADLMSQAGASDAAAALKLVSGTTVQEGKYAVVRGLPDRYVNSQMNSVRLPTADIDKRAVQLDQFPASVIESIQVSKTFTPDQQGDASGGAVNVILKGIPDEGVFKLSTGTSFNSQVKEGDFLTWENGNVRFWGKEDRSFPFPVRDHVFDGPVGVYFGDAPADYDWSLAGGGKHVFDTGLKIGGFGSFYYKRDRSFFDDGIDDSYWVEEPGDPMTPQYGQGAPDGGKPEGGDFKTSLFDVTQGSEEVQWGGLGTVGLEIAGQSLTLVYMYTNTVDNTATLAEDTRGKEYYFPGYNRYDTRDPGNRNRDGAPYLRLETLQHTERLTKTLQLRGRHVLPIPEFGLEGFYRFLPPEVDWTIARSMAGMYQPDKRQFGSLWWAKSYNPGFPPWVPPFTTPEVHRPLKPSANFTLGNLQRIWKSVEEESKQHFLNAKFPFKLWSDNEGYFKMGVFKDEVLRTYRQESFSNFNDNAAQFLGPWEEFWSAQFPFESHPLSEADIDVDYDGRQLISATYHMMDLPLASWLNVIGGIRFERTQLSIENDPEEQALWLPQGALAPVRLEGDEADVSFRRRDSLPSIGFVLKPIEQVSLRGSYAETVARQTFKELTPIQQMEYLGGEVFIGNPELGMSTLRNHDLRLDYTPYQGALVSISYFKKYVDDPIEYVQRVTSFAYTTAENYPEGWLKGYEFEVRQDLGPFWDPLNGLSIGGNATIIDSRVFLPEEEAEEFWAQGIEAPMPFRDMMNAPEHLYNLYLTYDLERTGTQFAVFHTVKGDTLVAGAGTATGNFIPNVYAREYGTLNVSISQKIGKYLKLQFQAKNLTNPKIEEVYRSPYIGEDVVKTSYRSGIEYSVGISAVFKF